MKYLMIGRFSERFANGAVAGSGFAFAVLIISAVYAATLNYTVPMNTVSTGSGLSALEWNKMVANFGTLDAQLTTVTTAIVPRGAIMAFFGASCPSGWNTADGTGDEKKTDGTLGTLDLRGEFIRGLDNGRGLDTGRTLGSWQNATRVFQFNSTNIGYGGGLWDHDQMISADYDGAVESVYWGAYSAATSGAGISSWAVYGVRVRPHNVALLYCVKD